MLGIAAAAALCVFAAALAYDPGGAADPAPLAGSSASDGEALRALDEAAGAYRAAGQDAEAEEREEAFQQKLAEVARGMLGVEVSSVDVEAFFPGPPDRPGQICGSAGDIPAHLAQVRIAEWYVAFMEKYSSYPIKMHLNDARPEAGFYYGFVAISGDGKSAITRLHVDPCTGEVADPAVYLWCSDESSGYTYISIDYDAIAVSLELEEFCVIPVSPWRQAFYDYFRGAEETLDLHRDGTNLPHHEQSSAFIQEEERLKSLRYMAWAIYHEGYSDAENQEHIQDYCDAYGPLPEDFTALIESDEADRFMSAC